MQLNANSFHLRVASRDCVHRMLLQVVEKLSGHVETAEPLPREIWQKIVDARVYMAGTAMLRQLFFGMADMALHTRPASHVRP